MNQDVGQVLAYLEVLLFEALVPVDNTGVLAQEELPLLIAPVEDIGLSRIGLAPRVDIAPLVPCFGKVSVLKAIFSDLEVL